MAKRIGAPAAAWLACAGSLVLLALIAYGVDAAQRLDAQVLAHLSAREESLGAIAEPVAHIADPLPLLAMLIVACAIAVHRRRPLDALAAVVVVAGANVTTQLLKVALAHPRYQPILDHQLGPVAFPSGHATAAASITIAYLFVVPAEARRLTAVLGACLSLAVGISIVVIAWHYPSDVLGGYHVAAGWGFAVLAVSRAWRTPPSRRSSRGRSDWRGSRGSPPSPPAYPSGSA
jgi:membrane-associated phospholipid phosphatase